MRPNIHEYPNVSKYSSKYCNGVVTLSLDVKNLRFAGKCGNTIHFKSSIFKGSEGCHFQVLLILLYTSDNKDLSLETYAGDFTGLVFKKKKPKTA